MLAGKPELTSTGSESCPKLFVGQQLSITRAYINWFIKAP